MALKYASDKLKRNKEVVMTAVNSDERALEYAGHKVKKEITIQMSKKYNNQYF